MGNGIERRERPSSSKSIKQRLRTSVQHGWFLQPERKPRADEEEPNEAVLELAQLSGALGRRANRISCSPKARLKGRHDHQCCDGKRGDSGKELCSPRP